MTAKNFIFRFWTQFFVLVGLCAICLSAQPVLARGDSIGCLDEIMAIQDTQGRLEWIDNNFPGEARECLNLLEATLYDLCGVESVYLSFSMICNANFFLEELRDQCTYEGFSYTSLYVSLNESLNLDRDAYYECLGMEIKMSPPEDGTRR